MHNSKLILKIDIQTLKVGNIERRNEVLTLGQRNLQLECKPVHNTKKEEE